LVFAISQLEAVPAAILRGLERFGRRSLFIYWIHVELVYGYVTWPIHRALPVWGAAAVYLPFCALMFAALRLPDWREAAQRGGSRAVRRNPGAAGIGVAVPEGMP
jgi:uncharacterized membrane protein